MIEPKRDESTLSDKINMTIGFCQIAAMPVMLLIRRWGTIGERISGGAQMVLGCAGLLVLIGLSKEAYLLPFVGFVLLILLLVHKGRREQYQRKGVRIHSMYTGVPWLPGDEAKLKGGLEPALVILAGMFTLPFSIVLGGYLMFAGMCLGTIHSHWQLRMKAQVRAITDARIEHETLREALERERR